MATEMALAISYRALGVDFRRVRGLARELAIPTERMIAASRKPSVVPPVRAWNPMAPKSSMGGPNPRLTENPGKSRAVVSSGFGMLKIIRNSTLAITTNPARKR
jgi:hypothetical protein